MQAWCMEHPWMTFFLGLAAVNGLLYTIRVLRTGRAKSRDL